jgi:hypothetical protein
MPRPPIQLPHQILKNIPPPNQYPPQNPLRLNRPHRSINPLKLPLARQHPNLTDYPAKPDRLEGFRQRRLTPDINDIIGALPMRKLADFLGPLGSLGVVDCVVCSEGFGGFEFFVG